MIRLILMDSTLTNTEALDPIWTLEEVLTVAEAAVEVVVVCEETLEDHQDPPMGGYGGFRGGRGGFGGGRGGGPDFGGRGGYGGFHQAAPTFGNDYMKSYGGDLSALDNDGEKETTQVTIPKDTAGAIIGPGGNRIRRIRSESRCNITIGEADAGSSERIITIVGTSTQIQLAQYLLQQSVREHGGSGPPPAQQSGFGGGGRY